MALFEKKPGAPVGNITVRTDENEYVFDDSNQVTVTDPDDISTLRDHPYTRIVGGSGTYTGPPVLEQVVLVDGVLSKKASPTGYEDLGLTAGSAPFPAQATDVDQGAASTVVIDWANKPFSHATLNVTGPVTVNFSNVADRAGLILVTRTASATPTITWDSLVRWTKVDDVRQPGQPTASDGISANFDVFSFTKISIGPGGFRIVGSSWAPWIG